MTHKELLRIRSNMQQTIRDLELAYIREHCDYKTGQFVEFPTGKTRKIGRLEITRKGAIRVISAGGMHSFEIV